MRMQQVTGAYFVAWCIKCGKRLERNDWPIWADLDGEPFKAYYCAECKQETEREDK